MNLFEQAKHWAAKAEGHRSKGRRLPTGLCQRTMWMLAQEEEQRAHQTVTHALAFDAARRRGCIPQSGLGAGEDDDMLSNKSGLHPYRAALFFILREKRDGSWSGPKSNEAMTAGDLGRVSHWYVVRCLASAFGKTNREVARDLIDTYRALEDGMPAP